MEKKLAGKAAIVTGATSGIGLATAKRFAQEGAQVVFCGRRKELGTAIQDELRGSGAQVTFVQADCTSDADLERLVDQALSVYGKIDILYNNAGVLTNFAFEDIDMQKDYDALFNTNVRSYFYLSKLVIPHMLSRQGGVIVNTASIGGLSGGARLATYCSSKGAVLQLTRCLAVEFGGRGIRVNAISPGLIYTEMMPRDGAVSSIVQNIPMGRGGEAEEIAAAVLFLVSDDSSFCNGINLVVDGGQTAQ